MPNTPQASTTTWAAILSFLAVLGGGLLRFLGKRAKENHDNDASLEDIRNKGIVELLSDYRGQVASLRTDNTAHRSELFAQGMRHAQSMKEVDDKYNALELEHAKAMQEADLRYELLEAQYKMLEKQYAAVVEELTKLKAQVEEIRARQFAELKAKLDLQNLGEI